MMVESSGENLKITRPEDLEIAELLLSHDVGALTHAIARVPRS